MPSIDSYIIPGFKLEFFTTEISAPVSTRNFNFPVLLELVLIVTVSNRDLGYVLRASDQRARTSLRVQAIGDFVPYVTATG